MVTFLMFKVATKASMLNIVYCTVSSEIGLWVTGSYSITCSFLASMMFVSILRPLTFISPAAVIPVLSLNIYVCVCSASVKLKFLTLEFCAIFIILNVSFGSQTMIIESFSDVVVYKSKSFVPLYVSQSTVPVL